MNILFVEDSGIILLHYKKLFALREDINTYVATTIKRAKTIMSNEEINIITLDISLPDGNGMDFLKWVKQEYFKMCVIMMSCYTEEMIQSEAKKFGANYFLDKGDCEKLPKMISEINYLNLQNDFSGGGVKEYFS